MTSPSPASRTSALAGAVVLGAVGFALRWWMRGRWYGHEEEDWGTLEIIRGILDTKFQFIETEHMPLFTTLSAYATMATGDGEVGAEFVAVTFGAFTVGLTVWLGARWLSPGAGLLAGLLVATQPESVLYAASPLRESTYTALLLLGVALVGAQHYGKSAVVLAGAFLTRFNAAFTVLPALALHALSVRGTRRRDVAATLAAATTNADREAAKRAPGLPPFVGTLVAGAALLGVAAAWARYYHGRMGTWVFWGGVMERNTGDAVADLTRGEHAAAVLEALLGVAFRVVPSHVGWAVVPLSLLGAVFVLRGRAADPENARWLTINAATTVGLLLTTAVVSTYPSDHNLYWKWLTPSVPFFALLGAHGALQGARILPSPTAVPRSIFLALLGLGLAGATALGYVRETKRQLALSDRLYGTQIRLADWLESERSDVRILTTGIPASYLARRASDAVVLSWHAEDLPRGEPDAFGEWLVEKRVDLVWWMGEDWTGAPQADRGLRTGRTVERGPVRLVPIAREGGYGWIAYRVEGGLRPSLPDDAPARAGGSR